MNFTGAVTRQLSDREYEITIVVGTADTTPSPTSATIFFDTELWTAKTGN